MSTTPHPLYNSDSLLLIPLYSYPHMGTSLFAFYLVICYIKDVINKDKHNMFKDYQTKENRLRKSTLDKPMDTLTLTVLIIASIAIFTAMVLLANLLDYQIIL